MVGLCLLVTFVSPAKKAESIDMPFGGLTQVGPRKHVLDGSQGQTNPFATAKSER